MSAKRRTAAQWAAEIEKQKERIKQMEQAQARAKTAEQAKANADIVKALKRCNDLGFAGGRPQDWDAMADWLNNWADRQIAKVQQQQQQGPAV